SRVRPVRGSSAPFLSRLPVRRPGMPADISAVMKAVGATSVATPAAPQTGKLPGMPKMTKAMSTFIAQLMKMLTAISVLMYFRSMKRDPSDDPAPTNVLGIFEYYLDGRRESS